MSNIFKYYKTVRYNNIVLKNLLSKSRFIKNVFEKNASFYDYVIKEGERADLLAYRFYGDSQLDWVLYLPNDIIDPYYDWPLEGENFISYLEMKYNSSLYEIQGRIAYYKYTGSGSETEEDIKRIDWTISEETYNLYDPEQKTGWSPVYAYDYEVELNENKRNIKVLVPALIPQLKIEMGRIFNE